MTTTFDTAEAMPDDPFMLEIKTKQQGPVTIVTLVGDLVGEDVGGVSATLADAVSHLRARVAIDLENTKSISSSGLGCFMECVTRARIRDGQVILVAPNPLISGVLSVTHLDHWFEICDTLDDALRRLSSDD
jgi:anti-anti-sigma factor